MRAVRTRVEASDLGDHPDEGDDVGPLTGYFERLPIPLLKLPPTIATTPWALTLIGHEVGHFVQPLVGQGYPKQFAEWLTTLAACAEHPSSKEIGINWPRSETWTRLPPRRPKLWKT